MNYRYMGGGGEGVNLVAGVSMDRAEWPISTTIQMHNLRRLFRACVKYMVLMWTTRLARLALDLRLAHFNDNHTDFFLFGRHMMTSL
jgi:hypothetical protein